MYSNRTALKQAYDSINFSSFPRAHLQEKFLSDLRKARETYTGIELANMLHAMRRRLDDPAVLSGDTILNMLISYREIQDYDAIVHVVDDLKTIMNRKNYVNMPIIRFMYAFAMNRYVFLLYVIVKYSLLFK